ncbi:MAG: sulfurtransferase [Ectothiorhodospiraceae bacterium]|nr:sulfurtransferase [Ectothiorhodospiraceae bacterium]
MTENTLNDLPLLIEPDELEPLLGTPGLLILDLCDEEQYRRAHVPGAVHMEFSRLVRQDPPAMGLLPTEQALEALFSEVGLTPDTHIVAYDNTGGGRAGRLLWTLDVVGHPAYSMLNGGLPAWAEEGHPLERTVNRPRPGHYTVRMAPLPDSRADMAYVQHRLGAEDVCILDARSAAEYRGEDIRAARGGHIPGAVNLDWMQLRDPEAHGRLRPAGELMEMLERIGATPDKEIITHCQTHHRSSLTWVALRALGYQRVRGYDGSWSEWGNDAGVPVER